MKQEDKELLLIDLSARLPFKVKVKVECTTANGKKIEDEGVLNSIYINEYDTIYVCVDGVEYELEDIKPYLRPMSSQTSEEREELNNILEYQYYSDDSCMCEATDWLNKNMFDFRGLIPADLASSTDEFNPYKH